MAGPDLSVFAYAQRRGKASVLNDVMAMVSEPIVVFTDANVEFEPDAVACLVDALEVREAGAVCGELLLQNSAGDNQDALYWRLERYLKESEGKLDALLGANGAIYAIRRELYRPLRDDTIIDDFVIAMRVAAEGRALAYVPEARAREDTPDRIEDEFRRRVRIGVGNYQALFRHPEFLFRAGGMRSFAYFSHKVLRWLGPHLLIMMLVSSWWARDEMLYRSLLALQVGAYVILLLAYGMRRWIGLPRLLSGLLMLMVMNLAFLLAFARFVGGDMRGQWSRTERRPST
jgi:cellulose synthase/poly-beta-1,6-N-acetylglucosamine synthase-like glycosyltransferase